MANSAPGTWTTITGQHQGNPDAAIQTIMRDLYQSLGPQTSLSQLQANLSQAQLGLVGPEAQMQTTYNQAMAGYQGQNLGLTEQGTALQGQALDQRAAQQAAQQGYEQQGYALQQTQYPEQQAQAALAYQNSLRNMQGSQAIGGTQNTVGGRADVATLGQNYAWQQQDIARNQQLSQIGQAAEVSGYGYSQQQIQNARQQLALSAKANGLSEQQLMTMLQYGKSQVGAGAAQDVISILSGQAQNIAGNISNIGAIEALTGYGQNAGVNLFGGGSQALRG